VSLQSRLATLITAIGTDIKDIKARQQELLAIPQLFLRGSGNMSGFAAGGVYWITSEQGNLIAPNTDSQNVPISREFTPSKFDVVTGYKPQLRFRTVIGTNGTDPGTQTFSIGVTGLQTIAAAGAGAGGANNRRWTLGGTILITQRTNLAAATEYVDESGWFDATDANFNVPTNLLTRRIGVYNHCSVTPASNALVSVEWEIELRYVPE